MAWESRRGRGRYYTRTRRVGGRFVREYVGAGADGERAAAQDAALRAGRQAEAQAWRAARARLDAADATVAALADAVRALVRAHLLVGGFRCHARGSWRRRRGA
jgi:hypothetical protein